MDKQDALRAVREATAAYIAANGTTLDRWREANAHLAQAQLRAAWAGASSDEISDASSWNGVPV
jgi:hypothetical protein